MNMHQLIKRISFVLLAGLLFSTSAHAATFQVDSALFGYMRGTYGNGSRYGAADGYDRIGLSQFAVGLKADLKDNYRFVGLFAADILSNGDGSGDKVGIKDTFIEVDSIANSPFGISIGAQPFLFGLKANGYPGDHSIQPSIEFMNIFGPTSDPTAPSFSNRSFAVSQQAGPSAKITYNINKKNRVVVGAFDSDEEAPTKENAGSSVHENAFFYFKSDELFVENLRLFAGAMTRYIGLAADGATEVGKSRAIYDLGLSYSFGMFSLSVEGVSVEKEFAGTADNEMLTIAEFNVALNDRWEIYLDYGNAAELEITTWRGGVRHQVNDPLSITAEMSQDVYANGFNPAVVGADEEEVASFDIMLHYAF